MKVLVTGSSGLIGTALRDALRARGDEPVALGRSGREGPSWDPERGVLDPAVFDGVDAVVHLAGRSIGEHRWSTGEKQAILESRTRGTTLLASTLARLGAPPKAFVSASAIGYYGNRGDDELTEDSSPGDGFLADVVVQGERATAAAENAGIRTVRVRTGIVLDAAVTDLDTAKGTATVIASVDLRRQPRTGAAATSRNRLRGTLTRVHGHWLLSDLGLVQVELS